VLRRTLAALIEDDDMLIPHSAAISNTCMAIARIIYVQTTHTKGSSDVERALENAGAAALDQHRADQL
jgi:hypothetical protein